MDRYKKKALNFSSAQDQRFLRAQRRSVDRKSIRDNDLFLRRRLEPLEESNTKNKSRLPAPKTAVKVNEPASNVRLQLLQKWKAEKEMKKKMEAANKKPVFKVTHIKYPSSINGSSGDFQTAHQANVSHATSRLNAPDPTTLTRTTRSATAKSRVTVPSASNSSSSVPKYSQAKASTFGFSFKTVASGIPKAAPAPSENKIQHRFEKIAPKAHIQKSSERIQKIGQSYSTNLRQKTTSLTKLSNCNSELREKSFAPPNFKFTAPFHVKPFLQEKPTSLKSSSQETKPASFRKLEEGTKASTIKIDSSVDLKYSTVPEDTTVDQSSALQTDDEDTTVLQNTEDVSTSNNNACSEKKTASIPYRRSARLSALQKATLKNTSTLENALVDQSGVLQNDKKCLVSQHTEGDTLQTDDTTVSQNTEDKCWNRGSSEKETISPSCRRSSRLSAPQNASEDKKYTDGKITPPSYKSTHLSALQKVAEGIQPATAKINNVQNAHLQPPVQNNDTTQVADCDEEKENIAQPSSQTSVSNSTDFNLKSNLLKYFEKCSLSPSSGNADEDMESKTAQGHSPNVLQKSDMCTKNYELRNKELPHFRRSTRNLPSPNISLFSYKIPNLPSIDEPEEYSKKGSGPEFSEGNAVEQTAEKSMPSRQRSTRLSALQNKKCPGTEYFNIGGKSDLESIPEANPEIDQLGSVCIMPKQNRVSLLGSPVVIKHQRGRVSMIKDDLITFSPLS